MFSCRYIIALGEEEVVLTRVEKVMGENEPEASIFPPGVMYAFYRFCCGLEGNGLGDDNDAPADEAYIDLAIKGNEYIATVSIPKDTCISDLVLMLVGEALGEFLLDAWVESVGEAEKEVLGPLDRPAGWGGNREDIEA